MPFYCTIPEDIKKDETIVLPISMNQPLERGERLASILEALDKYGYKEQVTILICDYLNRHNCSSEQEALNQGDQFILDHQAILKGYRLIRWKPFLNSLEQHKFSTYFHIIENKSAEGTRFYNKMRKTWEKCLSANQTLEASIQYQVEEYAATVCMDQFSHIFYPMRITSGMAYLYNFIEGKKPHYHHIKVVEIKSQTNPSSKICVESAPLPPNLKCKNHVHITFRALLEHIDFLLSSPQLSLKAKKIFAEEAENLFMTHGLLKELDEDELNSVNQMIVDAIHPD